MKLKSILAIMACLLAMAGSACGEETTTVATTNGEFAFLTGYGITHRNFGATRTQVQTWDAIAPETRDALRQAAVEAGAHIKAEGRRESVESVDAMRKRGLIVNPLTPQAEAQWRREMEAVYLKIRGPIVPADIFDEVTNQLALFRAGQAKK